MNILNLGGILRYEDLRREKKSEGKVLISFKLIIVNIENSVFES